MQRKYVLTVKANNAILTYIKTISAFKVQIHGASQLNNIQYIVPLSLEGSKNKLKNKAKRQIKKTAYLSRRAVHTLHKMCRKLANF